MDQLRHVADVARGLQQKIDDAGLGDPRETEIERLRAVAEAARVLLNSRAWTDGAPQALWKSGPARRLEAALQAIDRHGAVRRKVSA